MFVMIDSLPMPNTGWLVSCRVSFSCLVLLRPRIRYPLSAALWVAI